MSNSSNLNIAIEKFRAINNANISIDGISVIAGENGSGKSTISKLVYYLYKTINSYDSLVVEKLSFDLENIFTFLRISINDLLTKRGDRLLKNELLNEVETIKREFEYNKIVNNGYERLIDVVTKIQITLRFELEISPDNQVLNRLKYIAGDITKKSTSSIIDYSELFNLIKDYIIELFKEAYGYKKSRTTKIFKNELMNIFHDDKLPSKFVISEFGQEIVSLSKNSLGVPYIIQNVIYIDSPMLLGVETFDDNHWEDLNSLIKNEENIVVKNSFSDLIANEIIEGEASYDSNFLANNDYSFRHKSGQIFNLLDCATGVKSFSIIQMLLKNGTINDKTLLIIDEPESHLHPQWIIEYARLIVLLNKHIGVKFLIASHNPDMVSAIKIISEKEEVLQNVNFYLAEKKSNSTYDFNWLDKEINEIFASFNIAFERINLYGGE